MGKWMGKFIAEKLVYHFQTDVYWKKNSCFYSDRWHFAELQIQSLKAGVNVVNVS